MKTKGTRKSSHNIGTHEERMVKRRDVQRGRRASLIVRCGKYVPKVEDKKHRGAPVEEHQS